MDTLEKFGIVYHLVGEQTLPVFITAIQFPVNARHYLLTTRTKRTEEAAKNIRNTLVRKGFSADIKFIGDEEAAVSFPTLAESITGILTETNPNGEPAAFDLTGGTKPMSIVALLQTGKRPHLSAFYLDFNGRKLICLNHLELSYSLTESLCTEDFIQLAGMNLKSRSESDIPMDILEFFLRNALNLQRCQGDFAKCIPGGKPPKGKTQEQHFHDTFSALEGYMRYSEEWSENWNKFLALSPKNAKWSTQARFLAGEWFEHYVCHIIRDNSPEIRELSMNVELTFPGNASSAQEFDVVYTDGFSLIILECKAGEFKQEFIQKLENLRRQFSGALGRCALVMLNRCQPGNNQHEIFRTRIEKSPSIAAFCGKQGIEKLKRKSFSFSPGNIYE